ncbi:ABC-type Fe3+/spermidine/putrescine transport system ATPase subunit [Rhodoligotrophos appendicifer]|uniref:ABC transporter ATP-binding protein n=1 Tax=Rhodoligotrophos appendicifer TaxID=987056 RepID=UPI001185E2EF|nr:ABC transporter ATP-binding protein [Rhodoligotrophos appendicifer]
MTIYKPIGASGEKSTGSLSGGPIQKPDYLRIDELVVTFGEQRALDSVSFQVSSGERVCLLGPSGCGKTTCLRVIAGFTAPTSGRLSIEGRSMLGVQPEHRNIGILFQNYALFPHLTVYDNVAFGLRMRGKSESEIRARVSDALTLVRLPNAGAKKPAMLSGGEQQRIAFARAVIIQPSLLLLDEPFSNLDARLRLEMRSELLELLERLGISTIMVTHDQEEAMAIADRIIVMRAGRIEQVGSPSDIYEAPSNEFVATFVGGSNAFDGVYSTAGGHPSVKIEGLGSVGVKDSPRTPDASSVRFLIRPERVRLSAQGPSHNAPSSSTDLEGVVERSQYIGHRMEYRVRVGALVLHVWSTGGRNSAFRAGDRVHVAWDIADTLIFSGGAR